MERNRKEQTKERICKYKFWEPPASLRKTTLHYIHFILYITLYFANVVCNVEHTCLAKRTFSSRELYPNLTSIELFIEAKTIDCYKNGGPVILRTYVLLSQRCRLLKIPSAI